MVETLEISSFGVLLSEINCFVVADVGVFFNRFLHFNSFLLKFCQNLSKTGRGNPIVSFGSCVTVAKEL